MEAKNISDIETFDLAAEEPVQVKKGVLKEVVLPHKKTINAQEEPLINCLRDEKITVRCILKPTGNIDRKDHALYGGIAETAIKIYTLPILTSGSYKNALTNAEKIFLESAMGLEPNALSIYLTTNNYWDNLEIRLGKSDTILDLSVPEEYIKYKVLLANSNTIAPSLEALKVNPKETYRYVLIKDGEEVQSINKEMTTSMQASLELGKILNNLEALKLVVELMAGKVVSETVSEDWLKAQAFNYMKADPKLFIKITLDPYLDTKILIRKAVLAGIIKHYGSLYYREDSTPLSDMNVEPTLEAAVLFINAPKNQQYKLTLEAKLNALKSK